MIYGNIDGIRDSILKELEQIYDIKIEKDKLVSTDIISLISKITRDINREISVSIDRKGRVIEVAIGDSNSVGLPIIDISSKKLSGIKVIHTHPGGNSKLSMIDISALLKLKLDAILAIGVSETDITGINFGYCKIKNNELTFEEIENISIEKITTIDYLQKISETENELRKNNIIEDESEQAILVGVDTNESLDELEELAKACNISVHGRILQKIKKIDNIFYIGSGKVKELSMLQQIKNTNLIIFDEELSGIQIKNLEAVTGCKVIDRTILILEIFARRARSKEAKIQVELAQLKYRSQRLIGLGSIMSRTGGGIGTRGPGEKKLEIDRRRIKDEIYNLKKELEKIQKIRALQRNQRENSGLPKISLVGYTNVGKSTLRNLLVNMFPTDNIKKDPVFAENMLFATLDATTRTIILPNKQIITLTDTVGFVRKLPHELVEAFKSTLEEVIFSDILLHIIDSSSNEAIKQIEAVENVLNELGANDKPTLLVFNKCDLASPEQLQILEDRFKENHTIKISAKNNINIDSLIETIIHIIPKKNQTIEFLIPYSDTSAVAHIHRDGIVQEEEFLSEGTRIVASVNEELFNRYGKYKI